MFKTKLAKKIAEELQADDQTSESPIEVSDDNGVITLSGTALSNEARRAAGDVAKAQPGVISVVNDLTVHRRDIAEGIPAGANLLGHGPTNPTT